MRERMFLMGVQKCPGQDRRYWTPEDISEVDCPVCGGQVELWKDQGVTKCPKCGFPVRNPKVELGCAQWCAFATECIGYDPGTEDARKSIRERLLLVMQEKLSNDEERIYHTLRVLAWAEKLLSELGGSPVVVKAAVILHELGARSGRKQYLQVEDVLGDLELERNTIEEVDEILARFSRDENLESAEFKIFRDAHLLAELQEELDTSSPVVSVDRVTSMLSTKLAKKLADDMCRKRP
jgi:hypothetical protein